MRRVLIVDDDCEFADTLAAFLRRRGCDPRSASSSAAALALLERWPAELVFLDLHLPDAPGLDLLERLRAQVPPPAVAIVTAFPDLSSARAAIRQQVTDYLCKPCVFEELDGVLRRVFGSAASPAPRPAPARGAIELVGTSAAVQALRALVGRLAASDVRVVLVTGESGTGKELVARLLHAGGPRAAGPFVEVNCAALTESLFESEVFGHERGAFTGAVQTRRGLAELAHRGTLFLDEVAELTLGCQAKLLRFLDDQRFRRVGGARWIEVDVQVVAATNRDLREGVAQRTFREDLYFRLNLVPLALPPLRERPEDVAPLARYWLDAANRRYGRHVRGFTPEAEARLRAYTWPGNVRELRNLVERLVILCPGEWIEVAQLPPEVQVAGHPAAGDGGADGAAAPRLTALGAWEQAYIRHVLASVGGNKTRAARILGITRQTLRAKLGRVGDPPPRSDPDHPAPGAVRA